MKPKLAVCRNVILGKRGDQTKEKKLHFDWYMRGQKRVFLRYRKVKKGTAHYSGLLVIKRRKKGIKYQVTHLVWILLQIGIFIWKKQNLN